ncbi:MAG TPA: efflux RND transporter periplasmic adaptor subunit [Anaerolineales bacterium]|nr:efflux RND transporter periplasmic adaptor subunit [Anaerolineales bacterium]
MHPDPRRVVPIILLVIIATAAIWYLRNASAQEENGPVSASGTVEATKVELASETGGKVDEVLAGEGDSVNAGAVLVQFNDQLVQAQRTQAEAALSQAEANYALVAAGLTHEQRQAAITAAETEFLAAQQAMQDLNDAAEIVAARTLQEIARAKDTVDKATQRRDNLIYGADQADIDAARAAVVLARDRLDKAQEDYAPYENKPEDNLARAALLSKMAAAQNYYDRAATLLNNLVAEANELDLGQAEADLAVAKSQLADAERRYAAVKDGPDPDAVALAGARLASTKARLDQARADPSQEQLELAQSQIDTAGAALQVLETQLQKMVISAPIDGIVLERLVEPGEVALPSAPLLTLARLDDLTITVYVPEDRYGEIKLGQPALVVVDSFPGETFSAMVTHIADQAEFTPRNVQTVEGRSSTVFAIKLAIENPNGQLKPGMPADVTFEP